MVCKLGDQVPAAAGDKSTVSFEELGTNKHDNKPSINALENTKVAESDLEQRQLADKTTQVSSTKVNRDFFKKHLLHGIKNNGNTCYM